MNKGKITMNWKETTWQGYGRQNGAAGIRNKVLRVIYTVECASFVAQEVECDETWPQQCRGGRLFRLHGQRIRRHVC